VQVTQLLHFLGVGAVTVFARHLHHRRQILYRSVPEEDAEALAHHALTDVRVPVAVRAERRLRVIHVQRA
jgi:hypothetical protein